MAKDLFFRSTTIDTNTINVNDRTVKVVFSSTTAVRQAYGMEVLSHNPADVDLTRFRSAAGPVLLEHSKPNQIGVIEDAVIDGDVGRALLRFSTNKEADEVFNDIVNGIRSNISVGYSITDRTLIDAKAVPPVYSVKWAPFEISVVSVPADIRAGVGRSLDTDPDADGDDDSNEETDTDEDDSLEVEERTEPCTTSESTDAKSKIIIKENKMEKTTETRALDAQSTTNIDYAQVERTRAADISDLATRHNVQSIGNEFIRSGKSVDEFRSAVLDSLSARQQTVQSSAVIGLTAKETASFDLGKAVRALATNDWKDAGFEYEACRAAATQTGKMGSDKSIVLPMEYMTRAMSVGGTNVGSDIVASNLLENTFLDALFNKSIAASLGVTYLPGLRGDVELPKFTSQAVAYEVGEGNDITASTPTTAKLKLSPRQIGVLVDYTRSMALQSTPIIEGILRSHIISAMNQKIDAMVFAKILGDTSINYATSATGVPTWAGIVEAAAQLENANINTDNCKWAFNPLVDAKFQTTLKDTNYAGIYLKQGNTVGGYASATSRSVTGGHALFGDFSFVNVAQWGTMELALDTSQLFASGGYRLRAFADLDVGIRRDEAFSGFNDITV